MKIKATLDQVNRALGEIQKVGKLEIEGNQGRFLAKGVAGRFSYNQKEEELTIIIDDKPFLASDAMIESEIRKFFK